MPFFVPREEAGCFAGAVTVLGSIRCCFGVATDGF